MTLPAPTAASWFTGTINAAKVQANLTDPINAGAWGLIGESTVGTAVTLATVATYVASSASVTFTLTQARRVLVLVMADFQTATTTNAGFLAIAAYSPGATANVATQVNIGRGARQNNTAAVANNLNWACSATSFGSALLPAGQYTAYCACQRTVGGSATDLALNFDVTVLDFGSV